MSDSTYMQSSLRHDLEVWIGYEKEDILHTISNINYNIELLGEEPCKILSAKNAKTGIVLVWLTPTQFLARNVPPPSDITSNLHITSLHKTYSDIYAYL